VTIVFARRLGIDSAPLATAPEAWLTPR